jgi:hypothetical protein
MRPEGYAHNIVDGIVSAVLPLEFVAIAHRLGIRTIHDRQIVNVSRVQGGVSLTHRNLVAQHSALRSQREHGNYPGIGRELKRANQGVLDPSLIVLR